MSGFDEDVIGDHGLPGERVFFLAKPFLPADLAREVRDALRGLRFGASF